MHVQVVAADISLRAAIGDGAKAKRGIMLLWLLELWGRHRKWLCRGEKKQTVEKRSGLQCDTREAGRLEEVEGANRKATKEERKRARHGESGFKVI